MNKTKLRYCAIDSYLAGENGHPQTVMKALLLGMDYKIWAEPVPIGDAWLFWVECEHPLPTLPGFITEIEWQRPWVESGHGYGAVRVVTATGETA